MAFSCENLIKYVQKSPGHPQHDVHLWADYIELKCILNKDSSFSQKEFIDIIRPRQVDLGEGSLEDVMPEHGSNSAAEENDKWEKFAISCYEMFSFRANAFKEFYPFSLSLNRKTLTFNSELKLNGKIYLFLLYNSNLNYFKDDMHLLTSCFEIFCLEVFKNCIPNKAELHLFGSNNAIPERRFNGNLFNKIKLLARDLNEGDPKINEDDLSTYNAGDGGLDIVGWLQNGDEQPGMIIYLGQCACTTDWTAKQHSSSYDSWRNKINFTARPVNFVFVPFSVRNADGSWHNPGDLSAILIDRQRLTFHSEGKEDVLENLLSAIPIEEIINCKEAIY